MELQRKLSKNRKVTLTLNGNQRIIRLKAGWVNFAEELGSVSNFMSDHERFTGYLLSKSLHSFYIFSKIY
jgi:hypothetical protein